MNALSIGLLASLTAISFTEANAGSENILGQWQCQVSFQGSGVGVGTISFDQNGQCVIGGQRYSYKLQDSTLQISNGYTSDSYTYQLSGDKLRLNYHDGSAFDCSRQDAGGLLNLPGSGTRQQGGGNEWMLSGTFCHYSGSTSFDSSYSSASRINFDGNGNWTMGSESSFSSDAGSAYSGGGIDDAGTYSVSGRQIFYATRGGEQGVATVNMQQNDGRITEIYVGEDLYSPSLCN